MDNPIWNALLTEHSSLALGNGLARRYPFDVGPLTGIKDQSEASYVALRKLAGPAGVVALFLDALPCPTPGWTFLREGLIDQMICLEGSTPEAAHPAPSAEIRRLTSADVPAMIELAELTEPGPFHRRTIDLGAFYGIFHADRLMAMSGQRLHLPQHVEVSAVCTHPEARGRGYARALMARVMEDIRHLGKTPILHVLSSNPTAIAVYESLGFTLRRKLHLAVLKNDF